MKKVRNLIAVTLLVAGLCLGSLAQAETKKTITVWCWDYVKKCIELNLPDFYGKNPGTAVEIKLVGTQNGDIYNKVLLALSAGEGAPDVVALENSHLAQMVATGGLLDITKNAKPYFNQFNHYKWDDAISKGKFYAMPIDSGPVAIWYRRDVFEKAGLPSNPEEVTKLLDTWEDFYKTGQTIKEKTGSYMFQMAGSTNDGRLLEILLQQQSLGYFDKNGKVILDKPQAAKILDFLGKCNKAGLCQDALAWTDPWYAGQRDGKVATIIEAVWMGGFLKSWIAPETTGKWGVVRLPRWERGKGVRASNDGGSCFAITNQTKNKDLAWKFTEFMTARVESQMNMFKSLDSFPSLESTYTDPFFTEKDPFFGNQAYREVFKEVAMEIPYWSYTKDYAEANQITQAEIQSFLLGKQTAVQALKKAAQTIREKTRRK